METVETVETVEIAVEIQWKFMKPKFKFYKNHIKYDQVGSFLSPNHI